jgi:hypothetical protein
MNAAVSSLLQFRVLPLLIALLAATSARAGQPTLKEPEVIKLSNAAAEKKGYKLANYEAPKAHYEYVRKDDSWWVFYQGKLRAPGNHFSVSIQDKTKKTEVTPGE